MAALAVITLCACSSKQEPAGELYSCDLFTVYPDSLISSRLNIVAHGDELVFTTPKTTRRIAINDGIKAGVNIAGSDTLLNYLFNRHLSITPASYDPLTPYQIFLVDALISPHDAMATLAERVSDGRIMQPESSLYGFPIVASDAAWALAAREVWLATGNQRWFDHSTSAVSRMLSTDRAYAFDRSTGLFRGVSANCPVELLPKCMDEAEIAAIQSLQTNINRFVSYDFVAARPDEKGIEAARMRDSLAVSIETMLWIPHKGRFSEMLYQAPYPIQSGISDNLSQALAVATSAASLPAARNVVGRTPLSPDGIPLFVPSIELLSADTDRAALTAALWCIASASVSNESVYALSLASLCYMAATNDYAALMLQGAVMRTIFGLSLTENGIELRPFIPSALGSEHSLLGFSYRDATFDIHISGTGDVISTFSIDDRIESRQTIPANLTGHHVVRINLSGFSSAKSEINFSPLPKLLPTPEVYIDGPDSYTISGLGDDASCMVYTDGMLDCRIKGDSYTLDRPDRLTFVSFVPFGDDDAIGLAAPAMIHIPPSDSITIPASTVAETGSRIFKDKTLAKRFVESRRFHNPNLTFEYRCDRQRDCWIQLQYVNGLGIVNPGLRYSLRTLSVNNSEKTLMVLPQLSPDSWRHDIEWWSRTGLSTPVAARLNEGLNTISVDYFVPANDYDDDANILIPLALRIIFR